jgi:hypothetical protein
MARSLLIVVGMIQKVGSINASSRAHELAHHLIRTLGLPRAASRKYSMIAVRLSAVGEPVTRSVTGGMLFEEASRQSCTGSEFLIRRSKPSCGTQM